ncbi:unnamed protein product [Gadus morhua 'NCC']
MEDRTPKEESSGSSSTHKGQESQSYQRRMWKNFTGKTKPWLSPKLGSERRSSGGADGSKKESGLWMFKRKKKQMDRVFSSSQPNLSSSHPPSFKGGESPGGDPLPGTSAGGPMQPLMGAAAGPTGSKPELTTHGSPKLAVTQLILSQQKSSSLGSACFEKLVVDPAVLALGEEAELRKNASDSVSIGASDFHFKVLAHTSQAIHSTGPPTCPTPPPGAVELPAASLQTVMVGSNLSAVLLAS